MLLVVGNLKTIYVPTSKRTLEQVFSLDIPLSMLNNYKHIDLAINNVDKVRSYFIVACFFVAGYGYI